MVSDTKAPSVCFKKPCRYVTTSSDLDVSLSEQDTPDGPNVCHRPSLMGISDLVGDHMRQVSNYHLRTFFVRSVLDLLTNSTWGGVLSTDLMNRI